MTDAGIREMARTNPYRYQEFVNAYQRYDNEVKARYLDTAVTQNQIGQQQRMAFNTYAAQQDAVFEKNHPEFQGEAGKRALAKLAEATVAELTEKHGVSREQITYLYQNDPNFRSAAAQEAAIALGRERLNRQAIQEKRVRPNIRYVIRHSADMVPKASEQRMAQLNRALAEKPSVRNAAKLLAERRRGR
jgi:hypothetical protein